MQKISVERLAKLIHEYVKNSAGDADKFKEYLLKLNLQLTRYFLQSLCQMATVDRYSREADEYIWLANALFEQPQPNDRARHPRRSQHTHRQFTVSQLGKLQAWTQQ